MAKERPFSPENADPPDSFLGDGLEAPRGLALKPRLVAISGPLEGKSFALDTPRFSIGRQSDNRLAIPEISVSRRHCLISRDKDGFHLKDLDSSHGTFIGGLPVHKRRLKHGDVLSLGNSSFLFLLKEAEPQQQEGVVVREGAFSAELTLEVHAQEAVDRHSRRMLAALEKGGRTAAELKGLLEVSKAVGGCRTLEQLGRRLLPPLLEAIPGERAALLLLDSGRDEFVVLHAIDRRQERADFEVSRTALERAVSKRMAMLCRDVPDSEELSDSESLHSSGVRSLLCAPLQDREKALGVLYIDTAEAGAGFQQSHLLLLAAAAAIASEALQNARYVEWLEQERRRLQAAQMEHGMVGESALMRQVLELIARVGPTESTVLIRGESGTGKNLAARAVHCASPRADRPFLIINCAALSETLIESELFGHEKGAFTGAVARRIGKVEAAGGGTLFLDEVGELSGTVQSKLLRVLESGEFERLGSNRTLQGDVRLIAATNRDLEKAIQEGAFRQDLFYRLNVISFTMPPLRRRRRDIPLLARHFAALHSRRLKRPGLVLSPEALRCLQRYDWPGNARELSNAIERAAVLATSDWMRPEDLPENVIEAATALKEATGRYHEAISQLKRRLIIEAVEASAGNVTKAAGLLGLHPNYLHRLIRSLGIKEELG
ncbi:MAG: sigma 54-interacting transcriptional regulator [Acidobacteriota bacterium]